MHEDIRTPAGCLVIRKCFCEIRVHDCKSGAAEVIAVAAFDPSVFLGDDRGIAHLAAGGGNGQDNADGEAVGRLALIVIKIPYIALIHRSITDCLCRVDGASASNGQDEINALFFT